MGVFYFCPIKFRWILFENDKFVATRVIVAVVLPRSFPLRQIIHRPYRRRQVYILFDMPTSAAIDGRYQHQLVQRSDASSEAAERRLQEAEKRLREAIEELQRHHDARRLDGGGCGGDRLPCCDHDDSCIAHAIGNLCQSFLLSYGVRVGIGILLRAFKLARRQSYSSIIDLKVSMFSFYAGNEISSEAAS